MTLDDLRNLGPVTVGWLREAGIGTRAELVEVGAFPAWTRLRFLFGRAVTLNALYALEAALRGCDWRDLPAEVRADLKARAAETGLRAPSPTGPDPSSGEQSVQIPPGPLRLT